MSLIKELKRRNVFKVAIAYLVVSWLLIQVTASLENALGLPGWLDAVVVVLLAIGLPIAILFAWAFELTPEGIKKSKNVEVDASISHKTSRKIDFIIIGALVLIIGGMAFERLTLVPTAVAETPNVITEVANATSIAVLPFVNMSSDPEQEFFSDGITEEILNALVRIDGLKVTARTSAFAYKGKTPDLRTVGKELNVANILEGSVRKSGTTIRITAQLINTADGTHIWSEVYDRELTDVFIIQDEIATAIAETLTLSLGLGENKTARTDDMQAYDMYLKANSFLRGRGDGIRNAIELYEGVIERDENYSPAWAGLAQAYGVAPLYVSEYFNPMSSASAMAMASVAATRALYLDDNNALAHAALGNVYRERRDWQKAEKEYERALAVDPDSALILEDYAQFLLYVGRSKEALIYAQRMAQLEPSVAYMVSGLATALLHTGQLEEAVKVYRRARALDPHYASAHDSAIAALVISGNREEARKFYQESKALGFEFNKKSSAQINWLIEPERFTMPPIGPDSGYMQAEVLAITKDIDGYLAYRARNISWQNINGGYANFNLPNGYMFADPRFKKFLVDLGLVDYFWTSGKWPDVCRPISDDDFECGQT